MVPANIFSSSLFQLDECKVSLDCTKLVGEKRKAEDGDLIKDLKKVSFSSYYVLRECGRDS